MKKTLLLGVLVLFIYGMFASRKALIIGNSAYADAPLKNPVSDARLMETTLRNIGYETFIHCDLDKEGMERAIVAFERTLTYRDEILFYYSGHGVQIAGKNYLVPIGAAIFDETSATNRTISLDGEIMPRLTRSGRMIVVLDACRDNPFGTYRSSTRGLAAMDNPENEFVIIFSTAANRTAEDGIGDNSEFTKALATHISTPGLDIMQVVNRVSNDVVKNTHNQRPLAQSGLLGDYILIPKPEVPEQAVQAIPSTPDIIIVPAPKENAVSLPQPKETHDVSQGVDIASLKPLEISSGRASVSSVITQDEIHKSGKHKASSWHFGTRTELNLPVSDRNYDMLEAEFGDLFTYEFDLRSNTYGYSETYAAYRYKQLRVRLSNKANFYPGSDYGEWNRDDLELMVTVNPWEILDLGITARFRQTSAHSSITDFGALLSREFLIDNQHFGVSFSTYIPEHDSKSTGVTGYSEYNDYFYSCSEFHYPYPLLWNYEIADLGRVPSLGSFNLNLSYTNRDQVGVYQSPMVSALAASPLQDRTAGAVYARVGISSLFSSFTHFYSENSAETDKDIEGSAYYGQAWVKIFDKTLLSLSANVSSYDVDVTDRYGDDYEEYLSGSTYRLMGTQTFPLSSTFTLYGGLGLGYDRLGFEFTNSIPMTLEEGDSTILIPASLRLEARPLPYMSINLQVLSGYVRNDYISLGFAMDL